MGVHPTFLSDLVPSLYNADFRAIVPYNDVMMASRRGLTLTELLIVIAIAIAVLGLGFALAPRAIAAAKDRSCASNLRQIGKGIALYAADHDDAFPSASLFFDDDALAFKQTLAHYGVADEQFYCPRDHYARTERIADFGQSHRHTSYTYGHFSLIFVALRRNGEVIRLTGPVLPPTLPPAEPSDFVLLTDIGLVSRDPETGDYMRTTAHGDRWNALRHDLGVENRPVPKP